MMAAESMLSKRRVIRITAALLFLLQLFSSHIYCIQLITCALSHSYKQNNNMFSKMMIKERSLFGLITNDKMIFTNKMIKLAPHHCNSIRFNVSSRLNTKMLS